MEDRECPNCGSKNLDCDEVDIGVGMQQVGPMHCLDCNWSEDDELVTLPDFWDDVPWHDGGS